MIKTYKYRLYPTRKQRDKLDWTLETCRILYNSCLVDRKNSYEQTGKSLSYGKQAGILKHDKLIIPYLKDIHSQVLQDVLIRVDKAYKAFFRRLKEKNGKAGHPRFKPEGRYDSVTYPQSGFSIDTQSNQIKIVLSKIGHIKLKYHRSINGNIKTCNIKKEIDKWYACFSVEYEPATKKTVISTVLGIDVGLSSFATLSDGDPIDNPRYLIKSEEKLIKKQKQLSHKTKGSNNRRKARIAVAIAHKKVSNQRKDFQHKASRWIVDSYDAVGAEDLQIRNMVKNHCLSKSIHDAGWGQFLSYIEYKAEEAGILFMKVNPRNTSQECICGYPVPKSLSDRTHSCPQCGLIAPRDYVSAVIVKQRCINKIRQELPEYTLVETGNADDIGYGDIAALKSTPSLKQEALQFIGE
jgi:putative transposase